MTQGERDWPLGHPASADYDPESSEAKAWHAEQEAKKAERDWPKGHPKASDTPARRVGNGYEAVLVKTEDQLMPGKVCLRFKDVLVVCCPVHGDRHLLPMPPYEFDGKTITLTGHVRFSCGLEGDLSSGVWFVNEEVLAR